MAPEVLTQHSERYIDIWRAIVLSHGQIPAMSFDNHYRNIRFSTHYWASGITANITYEFRLGWVRVERTDKMLLCMNPSNAYRQHNLPRAALLSSQDIARAVLNNVASSSVVLPAIQGGLAFDSAQSAVRAAERQTGHRGLTPVRAVFYVPGNIPRVDGNPYLLLSSEPDNARNRCARGHINLISGKAKVRGQPCRIYD